MVAMHRCRDCHPFPTCIHKLENRHLGGGILHCNPVRGEEGIGFATLQAAAGLLRICIRATAKMGIKDLFSEGKRSVQLFSCSIHLFAVSGIMPANQGNVKNHIPIPLKY